MNRGLVRLDQIIPGIGFPEPPPKEDRAPRPRPPKVIGDPTREPVNLQSALIVRKASWLYQPLPPEVPKKSELDQLREEVARLRPANTNLVAENSALRRKCERLSKLVTSLQQSKPVTTQDKFPEPSQSKTNKAELLERLRNGS